MHPGGPFASSTVVDGLINKPGGVCKVLLGCSVIHGCWVWGRKKYELQKWTKKYEKEKKKHPTVRSKEIRTKINHSFRMKTKRAIKTENGEGRRGGRPCHDCDPREGVPVLYHALQSQKLLFIQHCNVWHFLRGGGEYEPLFSLAAIRLAQHAPCIEMSAAYSSICLISSIYHW